MVGCGLHRRSVLAGLAATALLPRGAVADEVISLGWNDLLPEGKTYIPNGLRGLIDHDVPPISVQQPASSGVRSEWSGSLVRLPGFVVPIDHRGTGLVAFLLVPYVGACIHVPPPPANQLVFVTTEEPFESAGLFEAVTVTGRFGVSSLSTYLADVGYALSATRIERYSV